MTPSRAATTNDSGSCEHFYTIEKILVHLAVLVGLSIPIFRRILYDTKIKRSWFAIDGSFL
jgi:hypothetical protein